MQQIFNKEASLIMRYDSKEEMIKMSRPPPLVDRDVALATWCDAAKAALLYREEWLAKFPDEILDALFKKSETKVKFRNLHTANPTEQAGTTDDLITKICNKLGITKE